MPFPGLLLIGGIYYLLKDSSSSNTNVSTYQKTLFCKKEQKSFTVNVDDGIKVKYVNDKLMAGNTALKCPDCKTDRIGFFVKR
jgi:hypothetical protein